jgi:hypothetical protein
MQKPTTTIKPAAHLREGDVFIHAGMVHYVATAVERLPDNHVLIEGHRLGKPDNMTTLNIPANAEMQVQI